MTEEPAAGDPLADRLLRAGRGDEGAFAEIYDQVAPRVYGIALRVIGDPHQAQEAAQQAFVEIWRTAGRFAPERGSATGWIMALAHQRAVALARSGAAVRRGDDACHAAVDGAQANLGAHSIHTALACLSATQRAALELAYFGGHTHTDVARLMRAPAGTTTSQIRTGLLGLRQPIETVTAARA